MKKMLCFFALIVLASLVTNGQNLLRTPIIPAQFIEINNYKVLINGNGSLFYNLTTWMTNTEIPKGSNKKSLYAGSLWVAGLDENDSLHSSCDSYNTGVFQNGPVSNQYDSSYYNKYNKIWMISSYEIQYHINHYNDSGYTMYSMIADWPGNGDTTEGETYYMAPYVDVNGNNKYDPENGDYPKIRGDGALYFIYNDRQDIDTNKMGIEIHCMVYEYSDTTIRNNTFFINYYVLNKSQHSYHNVYLGVFTDFDIGNSTDDYILSDTSRNCFIGYNGDNDDDGSSGYGVHPPAQATVSLNHPFRHIMYFINDSSGSMNDPTTPSEYYNYMRSYWRDGSHLVYGGNGHLSGSVFSDFAFDVDSGWTENSEGLTPDDIRGIGSVGPIDLNPEESYCLDLAYPWAMSNDSNAFYSVSLLQQGIDEIQNWYDSQNFDCDLFNVTSNQVLKSNNNQSSIICYPNPTNGLLNIKTSDKHFFVTIFDMLGHTVLQNENVKTINLGNYPKGFYLIRYQSKVNVITVKIIKE